MQDAPGMIEGMAKKQQDVNLGKASIFLGVICVLGFIAASASGMIFYGVIATLAGLLAVTCAVMWSITRNALKR